VALALDCASSEFYQDGRYVIDSKKQKLSSAEFGDLLASWAGKYPILSIEDGMAESDWDGWRALTERLAARCSSWATISFVTNTKILREGIQLGIANSILVKVNQIGTLNRDLRRHRACEALGYTAVISHRSGETEDTTIADIAVGMKHAPDQDGVAVAPDRVAKYNQLLPPSRRTWAKRRYPGGGAFYQLR